MTVLVIGLFWFGHFNKNVECEVNGLAIDSRVIGMERSQIIKNIGKPSTTALPIKSFEEYPFAVAGKQYALVFHYEKRQNDFYVNYYKCIKVKPKLQISNYVIWH